MLPQFISEEQEQLVLWTMCEYKTVLKRTYLWSIHTERHETDTYSETDNKCTELNVNLCCYLSRCSVKYSAYYSETHSYRSRHRSRSFSFSFSVSLSVTTPLSGIQNVVQKSPRKLKQSTTIIIWSIGVNFSETSTHTYLGQTERVSILACQSTKRS